MSINFISIMVFLTSLIKDKRWRIDLIWWIGRERIPTPRVVRVFYSRPFWSVGIVTKDSNFFYISSVYISVKTQYDIHRLFQLLLLLLFFWFVLFVLVRLTEDLFTRSHLIPLLKPWVPYKPVQTSVKTNSIDPPLNGDCKLPISRS